MKLYSDCWTSGNPGIGGYRVVNEQGVIVAERNFDTVNTNNWYELAGIGAAIKAMPDGGTVFTDSKICMSWIQKGVSKDMRKSKPEYAQKVERVIEAIRRLPGFDKVKLLYIDGGSNPADYKRRVH